MTEDEIKSAADLAKAFLYSRGISADAIERGFNTPAHDLWIPDHATLFTSKLATSYATENDVAISGVQLRELQNIEFELEKIALYAAIKAKYPQEYRALIAQMRDGFLHGRTLAELRANVLPIVQPLYTQAMPTSSNDALLAYWALALEEALIFQQSSALECEAFLKGDIQKVDMGRVSHLNNRDLAVGAQLIRSQGSYPTRAIPEDVSDQDLASYLLYWKLVTGLQLSDLHRECSSI